MVQAIEQITFRFIISKEVLTAAQSVRRHQAASLTLSQSRSNPKNANEEMGLQKKEPPYAPFTESNNHLKKKLLSKYSTGQG
jgi:hypothetical protein